MFTPLIRHIATFGLAPTSRSRFDATDEPDLTDRVRRSRTSGLALASVAAGDLEITEEQLEGLADTHARMAAIELQLDSLMLQFLDDLGDDGVIVLKGAAHAYTEYPDPTWRHYGDLDVFVEPARFDDALAAAERRGYRRVFAPFVPAWDREFGKSVTLTDGLLEIDLHRNLSQGLALGVRPAGVTAHRDSIEIAAVHVPVLDADARFVHAAIHAFGGSPEPPLNGLIDLAWMARDPDRVTNALALARAWGVAGTFARAIRAAATLGCVPSSSVAAVDGQSWSPTERLRSMILARPNRRFAHDVAAGFLSLRGVRDRARFARGLARRATSGRDTTQTGDPRR